MKKLLIPFLAYWYIRFCGATTRWTIVGEGPVRELRAEGVPIIFALWHNQIMMLPYYYIHLLKGGKVVTLISLSRDGELISRVVRRLGFEIVRGSSSRRGGQAFMDLAGLVSEGYDVGITPDGPRGPRFEVQPGAPALASRTGARIVPIAYDVDRKKVLKTWDAFKLPLPFTRGRIVLGEPFSIAPDCSEEDLKEGRLVLKERLIRVNEQVETGRNRE